MADVRLVFSTNCRSFRASVRGAFEGDSAGYCGEPPLNAFRRLIPLPFRKCNVIPGSSPGQALSAAMDLVMTRSCPLIKSGVRMTLAMIEKCNSMLHKRSIGSAAVKQFVPAHDAARRNHGVDRFARGNAQRMEQPNVLRGRLLAQAQQGA